MSSSSGRFYTLDAMRGVAAIEVVVLHALHSIYGADVFRGYLAVDFFFALSGFVIETVYAPRIRPGLSALSFMKARVARLYPLFLVGTLLGLLGRIAQSLLHLPNAAGLRNLVVASIPNLLMLPSPLPDIVLFPLNIPAWSLFYELLINVVFALWLVRTTKIEAGLTLACFAIALIAFSIPAGSLDQGAGWQTCHLAFVRTGFSFTLGMLMGRFRHGFGRSVGGAAPAAVLVLAILLATQAQTDRPVYDLVLVMLMFPALLWLGVRHEMPDRLRKISSFLGDISYPLYAVHYSVVFVPGYLAKHFPPFTCVIVALFVVAMIGAAAALEHFYDAPVRRRLSSSFRVRWSAAPTTL